MIVAGCGDPPPVVGFPDGGFLPFEDGGPPRDGFSLDAFNWPDTGPPLPTVLPAQSWTAELTVTADTFVLTIAIDARAEAGIVRGVVGTGGRSSSVLFDIRDGILTSREAVRLGMLGDHSCSYDTIAFDQIQLAFTDVDHDGIHETLHGVSNVGLVTRSSGAMPGSPNFETIFTRTIAPDTTPPALLLPHATVIAPFEPVVLIASEPMPPSFMPRLVGPRTVYLEADIGASAPARWVAPTSGLPEGHYVLDLGSPVDLVGLAATALPTLEFDVAPFTAPAFDDVSPAVVAIVSATPTRILTAAGGDVPLLGTSSILGTGRTVIVFDAPAGPSRQVQMLTRFEGPSMASAVVGYFGIFDTHGALVGQGSAYQYLMTPSSVSGFDTESPAQLTATPFRAPSTGRYYMVIEPGGVADLSCTGMPPIDGVGITLDQITIL